MLFMLLYPIFKDRAIKGPIGVVADASCIIAVMAGTVGPIGFLGLQVSYGLENLFGIPDSLATQIIVIGGLVALYTFSAITGVNRGIKILSQFNIVLGFALLGFILLAGPTMLILKSFVTGLGTYVANFVPMALYRGDTGWLGWWTVFFWGWFLGYGPLMAMFISRVSRGRSARGIILMVAVVAPLVTNFWLAVPASPSNSLIRVRYRAHSKASIYRQHCLRSPISCRRDFLYRFCS